MLAAIGSSSIVLAGVLLLLIAAAIYVLVTGSGTALKIVGFGCAGLFLLTGPVLSFLIHMVHRDFGGNIRSSPIWWMLPATLAIGIPILVHTRHRLKCSLPRVGHCHACGYDLRGNLKAKHCPECGVEQSS